MKLSNLCLYRLLEPIGLEPEALAEQLAEKAWQPCGQFDQQTIGWHVPAPGIHEQLVHAAEGRVLLSARREAKLLPASVLREHIQSALSDFEAEHDRKMNKSERESLRERVTLELLPRAFSRSQDINVLIDDKRGWLIVDTSSAARAEEVTGLLRETLGSLRIRPPEPASDPIEHMTRWLKQSANLPQGFELGEECELHDMDAGAVVRFRRHSLHCTELDTHLDAGKRTVRLGLDWQERASFVLGDDLIVRKFKLADALFEEDTSEEAAARFDADFVLYAQTTIALADDILKSLGGESQPAAKSKSELANPEREAAPA